ncbi:MAG: AAA family ATPase [Thermodesulfobacteriota bacterium]
MQEKQGKLVSIGMPKLLHLIYRKGDGAAILDIVREPVKKRFFFKNGLPVAATSNILNEVLGRLLMQEGIITQRDYETSLQTVLKEKKKHGEVLISMGLITAEQLDTFLALQLKRRLWKIFGWTEGTYRYIKAESAPAGVSRTPIHPASLILDGINLGFYPAARIKADLAPYLDAPLRPVEAPEGYTLDDFGLNLQEKRFLSAFDGAKTLNEMLEGSDLLRHRALSIALSFVITGFLRGPEETGADELEFFEREHEAKAAEAPGDQRVNAEILFMRARTALSNNDYRCALGTLKEITDLNPVEGEYWAYLGWATYLEDPERIEEADRIVRDSIDLNNDLDSAWYFLGMLRLASGDIAMAEKAFRAAVEKNPWMLEAAAELKRLEIKRSMPEASEGRRAYIEALGLKEDPFSGSPEREYLVPTEGQTNALDFIVRVIRKKAGPALVTGVEGAGKTTLVLELLKRLSNEKVLAATILEPPQREVNLMKEINREIGSPTEAASIKEQLLNLGMRVSQNKIQGGQTVIVIDQAHRLTPGCLKLIQYLSRLKTIQIILLGEPGLAERLKDPDFNELNTRLVSRYAIPPMSAEETGAYVLKRLNRAGVDASLAPLERLMTEQTRRAVFEQSGGVPGRVNSAAAAELDGSTGHAPAQASSTGAAGEEEVESMAPPRIFPDNEMDLEGAKRVLEMEPSAEAPAQYRPFEYGREEASVNGAGATASAQEAAPAGKKEAGLDGHTKKGTLARAILWVAIVIAAAILAGILSGAIDVGSLINRARTAPERVEPGPKGKAPAPVPPAEAPQAASGPS